MFNRKCIECNNDITWGAMIKSYFIFNKPIKCTDCKSLLHINRGSKFLMLFLLIVIPGLYRIVFNNFTLEKSIFVLLIWYIIILLIFPLFSKFHIEDGFPK
ncbi:hypothetical protein GC105_13575 [Alkalibaculum sp. M08DMB]|uniref:Cxxc_20_cxxc protein n=1 Tax=Alkalibaculum sporogenes TaxID=2655001 RepID=A0A6A7KCT3_9FIRM|nr:TIGR04104 family putative zinc finger protein [Alkalibaculum sporogenes]MPW26813.1 hypothetical protein [Alkalibaculum sporogenes]